MATLAFIQSYRTCHIVTHPPDTDCAGALEYGQGARAPEDGQDARAPEDGQGTLAPEYGQGARAPEDGQDARAPLGSFNPAYL